MAGKDGNTIALPDGHGPQTCQDGSATVVVGVPGSLVGDVVSSRPGS